MNCYFQLLRNLFETRKHDKMTLKVKILYVFMFLIASTVIVKINYNTLKNNEEQHQKKTIDELNIAYNFVLESNYITAKQFFQNIINQPEVLTIFEKATSNDKKVTTACRAELFRKLIKYYNQMELQGVRQLHFHLPDNRSFLRFNNPQKHGDNLKGLRYSVEKVNTDYKELSGFEEGPSFYGFRNIFPITYNNKHLGSVGIGMSFQSISHIIEKMLVDKTNFIIKNENFDDFDSKQTNFIPNTLFNNYLSESSLNLDSLVIQLNNLIKIEASEKLNKNKPFVLYKKLETYTYHIAFIPIKNIKGEYFGYLISYEKDEMINDIFLSFLKFTVASLFVLFMVLILFNQISKKNYALKTSIRELAFKDKRIDLVLTATREGIWDWSVKTGEIFINNRWAEIIGYTLEQLSPISIDTWIKHTHPDDLVLANSLIEKHFSGETEFYECEMRMKHKSGEWIWVLDRGKVVEWDENKKPIRMAGAHQEITNRKKLERKNEKTLNILQQERSVFSEGSVVIFKWENKKDWPVEYVSTNVENVFGYSANEFISGAIQYSQLIHKKDSKKVKSEIVENSKNGIQHFKHEPYRMIHKNGKIIWFLDYTTIIRNESGDITHYFGYLVDISEIKDAETKLKRSEQNLKDAQKIAHIGHWELDFTENKIHRSPELLNIFKIDHSTPEINNKLFYSAIHPDDIPKLIEAYKFSMNNKSNYEIDYRLLFNDGSQKYVFEKGINEFNNKGKPLRSIGIIQDVTNQKVAEKLLKSAETRYKTVADFTYNWEYWQNPDKTLNYVSPSCERISGYSAHEFIANPNLMTNIVVDEDRAIWENHLEEVEFHEHFREIKFRIQRKDGEIIWIEHACSPVSNEEGIFLGYRVSQTDITDRKKGEEQLKSSLKEKDILLKEVHHRVKNNMQIVMSLLNLQANSIEDLVIRNAFAESNSRISAMGLIHETLYKSDNLSTIDPEDYINKLIQNTVRAFGSIDKKINHELEIEKIDFSLDETIPIALLVNEMLTNAYKYAFPNRNDGTIKIIFKNIEDDKILLKFSDNGIGMPSEIKPYEFESLGMQLIFDLVEGQLKGEIELDITNGTCFTIVFAKKQ